MIDRSLEKASKICEANFTSFLAQKQIQNLDLSLQFTI